MQHLCAFGPDATSRWDHRTTVPTTLAVLVDGEENLGLFVTSNSHGANISAVQPKSWNVRVDPLASDGLVRLQSGHDWAKILNFGDGCSGNQPRDAIA
jgi:hypothetical protein